MAPGSELSPTAVLVIALVFLLVAAFMAFGAIAGMRFRWTNAADEPIYPMSSTGAWAVAAFAASSAIALLAFEFSGRQWLHVVCGVLFFGSFIAMMRQVRRDRPK